MSQPPRKASKTVREAVIDALKDRQRRFIDERGSSRSWLDRWGIKADGLYADLIDGLECSDHLYLKPLDDPRAIQSYQCILTYPENGDDYPAIVVHVTLAPKGEPPRVRVAVHPSDTLKTLPPLQFPTETDEND